MIATYRLQLQPSFTFSDAEALIPYLKRLGISHLYLSPVTQARSGSTHGYDVIDHNKLRTDLGGEEGFESLCMAASHADLELILDFVPNHAGVGPRNVSWQDVLAYGPFSPYAGYFDIDWNPLKLELQGKILLPFLGSTYGEAFDREEISLAYDDGRFYAAYYTHRYALSPATYVDILETILPHYERTSTYWDLKDLLQAYETLAPRQREKAEALRPRLLALAERVDLDNLVKQIRGEALHTLLERQFWRLSYWKTAGHEINFRRFFDINDLVGLRMEDGQVFWDAHRLLGKLLSKEGVAGVRIDHVDGLFSPHEYLSDLRHIGAQHIWVEKILAPGETLPTGWMVDGTTGYEFMNDVMGILVYPEGEWLLDRTYRRFVMDYESYEDVVHDSKHSVMSSTLSSELFRLAYELDRISEADYHTRDFTLEALREALMEVVAAFDRYRTYLPHEQEEAREVVQMAVHKARQQNPVAEPTVYQFIAQVILGEVRDDLRDIQRQWTGRFQQYTAPVAAKGVEDTAFYRYLKLVALNEVGGEPGRFCQSLQAFHSHARYRALRYPNNLLATATHDHKRGEDTRMRLIVLAELPEAWDEVVNALALIADEHRGERAPSRRDEYLFFQVLAALWYDADRSELPERLADYMQKASRESKLHTSWINPEPAYEDQLKTFVRDMLADPRTGEAIQSFSADLARYGFFNILSQTVIKATTPGIPDFYQGCELFDLSLVDPDNRRPVDYERRKALLEALEDLLSEPNAEAVHAMIDAQDEKAKLYIIARLLRLRRTHPQLFHGSYRPLDLEGPGADYWIGYTREHEQDALVVLAPRFPVSWGEHTSASVRLPDELAKTEWEEVLSGAHLGPAASLQTDDLPLPWAVLKSV